MSAPARLDLEAVWLVGFMPACEAAPWWMRRLLRRGYAHCWAARALDANLWMWVEWTPRRIIYGLANDGTVGAAAEAATEVLEWRQELRGEGGPARPVLALHHCAVLVAHTVGVRPRPFPTPWWLRCALRKRGARPLMRWPQIAEGPGEP